jgi:7-keto-8-aminopelargonate synthetase-like enzyme
MLSDEKTTGGENITVAALTGSMFDFARPVGNDLFKRSEDFENWRMTRLKAGLWPFSRTLETAPGPDMTIADERGNGTKGISLACQDYLGLTAHPAIHEAARRALTDFGPHSAGSPALAGNTLLSLELEKELGEALGYEHIVLFPTGWAAGYASITGLLRPWDHLVMDQLAHACLQQGAMAATRRLHRHRHLDFPSVRDILKKIRVTDTENAIMVVTEGLFSMDSDIPDLAELLDACHENNATLLVDVAHDFGSMGPQGGGALALQNLIGKADLVMGSFSKTFSSNGGFLATHSEAVKQYMKFYGSPQTFSNALSPVQTAVIREALRIIRSEEGDTLRQGLHDNAVALRGGLEARGIHCIGTPSAIIPAHVGKEAVGRIAWSNLAAQGIHANLVEFPAVAVGAARFRMQIFPQHSPEKLVEVAGIVADEIERAKEQVEKMNLPAPTRPQLANLPGEFAIGTKALPNLNKEDIAKILKNAEIGTYEAGATILKQGEAHGVLLMVQKGTIQIIVGHQEQEIIIAECGEGEILGEMSMLDRKGASSTLIAKTDVQLARISQVALARLTDADPEFGMRFYQSLAVVLVGRLRKLNMQALPFEAYG